MCIACPTNIDLKNVACFLFSACTPLATTPKELLQFFADSVAVTVAMLDPSSFHTVRKGKGKVFV
jgi:hypothetical protein